MKKFKLILFILLSFIMFTNNIYATDENEDLTLSRIYVEPGTLTPEFSETRTYYTLVLDESTESLLIQATPTNENLQYEIKGNENLQIGENIVTITVYSSDKSKNKVYTINVLKTNNPDEYNALLGTLIVDNYTFTEDFFPEIFEYVTENSTNEDKVDVFAYPQIPDAKVEISGNTNLHDGENIITVKVTSQNGKASREYTININKGNHTSLDKTQSNTNIDNVTLSNNSTDMKGFTKFITISIILIIILIAVIIYASKKS